jgi:hypothetical protein
MESLMEKTSLRLSVASLGQARRAIQVITISVMTMFMTVCGLVAEPMQLNVNGKIRAYLLERPTA